MMLVRWILPPFALALMACATPDPDAAPSSSSINKSASAASASEPPPASAPSNDPVNQAFVAAHNLHRARVSPPAKPALPPVRGSDELAATAQAWADRCKFEHSNNEFGENLSARTEMAAPETIVAGWAAEAEHYDYDRNRCEPNAVCGHYTQVVWRESTTIGCAVAQCDGSRGGPFGAHDWYMWVCNYSPPGNVNRRRPY